MEQSVPKRRHMKFRRRVITQKIQHSKQREVGNREYVNVILPLKFKDSPTFFHSLCVRENISYMFSQMMTLTESKHVVDFVLNFKCKFTLT
jgi:hypothetical protein